MENREPGMRASSSEAVLTGWMEQYGEDVWNYAYFLCRRRETADDIAQETFIKAYRNAHTFRGEAQVKTWLFKIARNCWFSHRRSAFARRVALFGFAPEDGAMPSAEDSFLAEQLTHEVWGAVLALPAKDREILLLQAHHGLTLVQIAEMLGASVTAVKSRLRRAKQRAARLLKEKEEGR